jgi:hypothetical protein
MANRNLLHFSHLTAFHAWLLDHGFTHGKTYLEAKDEVARYRHIDRIYPLVLFQRGASDYLDTHERDFPLVRQFLAEHAAFLLLFS